MLDNELKLLSEYMNVYVQLLPYCVQFGGKRINKMHLPTFEYFKKTYSDARYSLAIPHYMESKASYNNQIQVVHTHGLGSDKGICSRYYNYWIGCKFFTSGNVEGNYILHKKT